MDKWMLNHLPAIDQLLRLVFCNQVIQISEVIKWARIFE